MMADRVLAELLKNFPNIKVDRIDILKHPAISWKDGIRMVPALKNGNQILSGIVLKENEILRFLEQTARAEGLHPASDQKSGTRE